MSRRSHILLAHCYRHFCSILELFLVLGVALLVKCLVWVHFGGFLGGFMCTLLVWYECVLVVLCCEGSEMVAVLGADAGHLVQLRRQARQP